MSFAIVQVPSHTLDILFVQFDVFQQDGTGLWYTFWLTRAFRIYVRCKDGCEVLVEKVCDVLFAYCRRFPDVWIDTVSGILEDFDFSLKSDQKRFGFNLGLLQRELK